MPRSEPARIPDFGDGAGSNSVEERPPQPVESPAKPVVPSTPVSNTTTPTGFPSPTEVDFPSSRYPIEPFADLEIVLRRHLTPAESPFREAVHNAPLRPIERLMAAIPDITRPQTIWVNVPENQFEDFKRELFQLGIIESESRIPVLREQVTDGRIRVKLTALPATEAAPQPTQR
jgi:hypothetical protein